MDAFSIDRLQPYLDASGGHRDRAIALYRWNISLSAAYWEVIAIAEVTVRNAMNRELTETYGTSWFQDPAILDDRSRKDFVHARARAARSLPRGSSPTPGKVISEVNFGTWVALLDRGGISTKTGRKVQYNQTLWIPALQKAFPNGPRHQRKTGRGIRIVQGLRNRIAHHEKIFPEPFRDSGLSHADLHEHCLEVINWTSPDVAAWARSVTRVPVTLEARPDGSLGPA